MKTITLGLLLLVGAMTLFADPHTPAQGSPERKAVCDAMRTYVRKSVGKSLDQPFLFQIEFIRVDGDYAGFEGFPVKRDGSHFAPEVTGDVVYTTFLKRTRGGWRVVEDLTRTDVPDDKEAREIRKLFPADVPTSVLPDFWRKFLRR
jgi:hypothetical protein